MKNMDRKKLIRISKGQIYLTDELGLPLSRTNLAGAPLSFKTVQDIYFEVEALHYYKAEQKLVLKVTDYQPKFDKFKEQTAKGPVSYIQFEPFEWTPFEKHLGSYTKAVLFNKGLVVDNQGLELKEQPLPVFKPRNREAVFSSYTRREPVTEVKTEEAKIPFKVADFNNGYVAFPYKSTLMDNRYNLNIENAFLRKEFNAVKSYFPKVFGGKKQFSITIRYTLTDKVLKEIVTTSPEIEGIDEQAIELINRERVAKLTATPPERAGAQTLFTADDIFNRFDEELSEGNVFKQTEEDILRHLLQTKEVRNATHLQYLSGARHSPAQRLKFTLKPLFGFLFFIEGDTQDHYCWELLNSHATYLWSFDQSIDVNTQVQQVEEALALIKDDGREHYKKRSKADKDFGFSTIDHTNVTTASKEGFTEWKQRLDQRLV